MPKFAVTVTGYRQFVVEAEDADEASSWALEEAASLHWQAETAQTTAGPLDAVEIDRAIRHGAELLGE